VKPDALRRTHLAAMGQKRPAAATRQLLNNPSRIPEAVSTEQVGRGRLLKGFRVVCPQYASLEVMSANGDAVRCASPGMQPENFADRPHLQNAIRIGRFSVSDHQTVWGRQAARYTAVAVSQRSHHAHAREIHHMPDYCQQDGLAARTMQAAERCRQQKDEPLHPSETHRCASRLSRREQAPAPPLALASKAARGIQLAAIGASTGGAPVLHKILSLLPDDLDVPLLVVQRISPGFVEGFVEWLASACSFPLYIAEHGKQPLAGHGYFAPDGFHMGIASSFHIVLSKHAPENGLRPSVAYLFRAVVQVLGARAVGVLLTGMGKDGAEGLTVLRDKGAITIA
jgi:chemotaxis response regulator CheB